MEDSKKEDLDELGKSSLQQNEKKMDEFEMTMTFNKLLLPRSL